MAADGAGGGAGRVEQHQRRALPSKSRASPSIDVGVEAGARQIFARCAPARAASSSTAVTLAPRAASCMVLPPGAAQRSITRLARDIAQQQRRARWRPRPAPTSRLPRSPAGLRSGPRPSTRRDMAEQRRAFGMRRVRVFQARCRAALRLLCARAMARATSSPYCALQRVHSQSGVLRRARIQLRAARLRLRATPAAARH